MVASLDPNVPVYLSAEMTSLVGDTISDRRFAMALLATLRRKIRKKPKRPSVRA
jgi:hypothetical protein